MAGVFFPRGRLIFGPGADKGLGAMTRETIEKNSVKILLNTLVAAAIFITGAAYRVGSNMADAGNRMSEADRMLAGLTLRVEQCEKDQNDTAVELAKINTKLCGIETTLQEIRAGFRNEKGAP